MENKKIYIDLGHGGDDKGILGLNKLFEIDVVKNVGNELKSLLLSQGYDVRLSNEIGENASLSQRSYDVNNWGADILISLHCNALDGIVQGIETYIFNDEKDRVLANNIHGNIIKDKLYNSNNGIKEKNLHILRESNVSSCMVLLGYIDNIEDCNLITANYNTFAKSICNGIIEYLNTK